MYSPRISIRYVEFEYSNLSRLGLDPKVLAGVVNTSSGRCWSSEVYNPVPGIKEGTPACNNYDGGFAINLMAKVIQIF